MRHLFYTVMRHDAIVRTLLILAIMTAISVALATAYPVLAGPDSIGP